MFKSKSFSFKLISLILTVLFSNLALYPAYAQAGLAGLPSPSQYIPLSNDYSYPVLKGICLDYNNPLSIEFIIDSGNQEKVSKEEAQKLINYFLAGLTIPEENLWVNLSPYEKDRIIPEKLEETDLGKSLLFQDYILKQLLSSVTHPESKTGRSYWDKTYREITKIAKDTNIPIDTFNKIWIMPKSAKVYEDKNTAFITEAKLKAMLETDLKLQASGFPTNSQPQTTNYINKTASEVMKQVILPKINQDVNKGKNFSTLRQIYHSVILAEWFKRKLKDSFYKNYINQEKIRGIDLEDKNIKEKVYNSYIQSFQKGLYDYIKKEDISDKARKTVERRYFSGGVIISPVQFNVLSISQGAASPVFKGSKWRVKGDVEFLDGASSAIRYTDEEIIEKMKRLGDICESLSSFGAKKLSFEFKPDKYYEKRFEKGFYSSMAGDNEEAYSTITLLRTVDFLRVIEDIREYFSIFRKENKSLQQSDEYRYHIQRLEGFEREFFEEIDWMEVEIKDLDENITLIKNKQGGIIFFKFSNENENLDFYAARNGAVYDFNSGKRHVLSKKPKYWAYTVWTNEEDKEIIVNMVPEMREITKENIPENIAADKAGGWSLAIKSSEFLNEYGELIGNLGEETEGFEGNAEITYNLSKGMLGGWEAIHINDWDYNNGKPKERTIGEITFKEKEFSVRSYLRSNDNYSFAKVSKNSWRCQDITGKKIFSIYYDSDSNIFTMERDESTVMRNRFKARKVLSSPINFFDSDSIKIDKKNAKVLSKFEIQPKYNGAIPPTNIPQDVFKGDAQLALYEVFEGRLAEDKLIFTAYSHYGFLFGFGLHNIGTNSSNNYEWSYKRGLGEPTIEMICDYSGELLNFYISDNISKDKETYEVRMENISSSSIKTFAQKENIDGGISLENKNIEAEFGSNPFHFKNVEISKVGGAVFKIRTLAKCR